jgi:hypothetical protein
MELNIDREEKKRERDRRGDVIELNEINDSKLARR